jgi:hypothetical protein
MDRGNSSAGHPNTRCRGSGPAMKVSAPLRRQLAALRTGGRRRQPNKGQPGRGGVSAALMQGLAATGNDGHP